MLKILGGAADVQMVRLSCNALYMSPFDYSEKQKENVPDDGGLDELAVIVRNMKKAAKEQNEEISAQIKTVDKLKAQTTHETSEMDKVKTRLKKVAS